MSKGFTGNLKSANADCELWHDTKSDLDYITFRDTGLRKIAHFYNEKYRKEKVVIEVSTKRDWSQSLAWDMRMQILNIAKFMNPAEVRGFVYVNYSSGSSGAEIDHVRPFILAKDRAGKLIVANFEEAIDGSVYQVKAVSDYEEMQHDNKSCGTFSIDTIKNCLRDKAFIEQLFDQKKQGLTLSKKVLIQSSKMFDEALNEEKKAKYLYDKEPPSALGSKINHKALYKSFDYMRKITSPAEWAEFEKLLSEKTKATIAQIDQRRADFKVQKDDVAEVASGSVQNPNVVGVAQAKAGSSRV